MFYIYVHIWHPKWDLNDILKVEMLFRMRRWITLKAISKFPLSACVAITGAEVSQSVCQCSFHAIFHLITVDVLYQLQQSTRIFLSTHASTVSLIYFPHKRLTWDCYLICPSFRSITWWSKINERKVVLQGYLNIWGVGNSQCFLHQMHSTSVLFNQCMYVSI